MDLGLFSGCYRIALGIHVACVPIDRIPYQWFGHAAQVDIGREKNKN